MNWLRGRNLTIRVDVLSFFSADTGFFKCPLFWVTLIHDHSIWIGSRGDDHGSVGATSHNSSVMHNILWEILSIIFKKEVISKNPFVTLMRLAIFRIYIFSFQI